MNLPTTNKSYNIMAYTTISKFTKRNKRARKEWQMLNDIVPEYNRILKSKTGKIEIKARATTRVDTSAFLK